MDTLGAARREGIGLDPEGAGSQHSSNISLVPSTSIATHQPPYPTRYVKNLLLAKLSAWYIMRGLRPMSPRTSMATVRSLGRGRGREYSFHTKYTARVKKNR